MDGRRGLFILVWRYTRVWMAALFSVSCLWVLWVAGACVEAGRVERALCSTRFNCGDCWGQVVGVLLMQKVQGPLLTASSFSPRHEVCLLWPQSPLDRPFLLWIHAKNDPSMPDGWVLWSLLFEYSLKRGKHFYAYTKARINLGQCVNSDWVVLGKNQDWLTHHSNPLIRMNWTLICYLAMNK